MLSIPIILFCSSFCSLSVPVSSFDFIVANWVVPASNGTDNGILNSRLTPRSVTVGDTITFLSREDHLNSSNNMSVYLHTRDRVCEDENDDGDEVSGDSVLVGNVGPDGSAKHVFTSADAKSGSVFFSSSPTCSDTKGGSVLVVSVYGKYDGRNAPTRIVVDDWSVPSVSYAHKSLPARTAIVGDVVEFVWGNENENDFDVYRLSRDSGNGDVACRTDGSDVVPVGFVSGSQYVFTNEDVERGMVTFACLANQGKYCEAGMRVTFQVNPNENLSYHTVDLEGGFLREKTHVPQHEVVREFIVVRIIRNKGKAALASASGTLLFVLLCGYVYYALKSRGAIGHEDVKPYSQETKSSPQGAISHKDGKPSSPETKSSPSFAII